MRGGEKSSLARTRKLRATTLKTKKPGAMAGLCLVVVGTGAL
jgi:hypothetical protein